MPLRTDTLCRPVANPKPSAKRRASVPRPRSNRRSTTSESTLRGSPEENGDVVSSLRGPRAGLSPVRKSGSHRTRRWRGVDSNHRSRGGVRRRHAVGSRSRRLFFRSFQGRVGPRGSHRTLRWREPDSNPRSRSQKRAEHDGRSGGLTAGAEAGHRYGQIGAGGGEVHALVD